MLRQYLIKSGKLVNWLVGRSVGRMIGCPLACLFLSCSFGGSLVWLGLFGLGWSGLFRSFDCLGVRLFVVLCACVFACLFICLFACLFVCCDSRF